ncbi:calcyclin-binding protein-like [Hibiscus syriacus]|uniref:calcyclin-binding protein-like n=1 Tax=Hibiscus syriacus TaxID=106335 RepID=UPI00192356FA|nr:calcyclin-binding protein-like [Hibiscus syriacus]
MAEELALDLEELKQLQCIAKRPRILSFISSEIRNLEKTLKEDANGASPAAAPQIPILIATSSKAPVNPALSYVTLASFSWDQDNDKVKIYVSLEGVEQEKIQADFKPISFDVKFHDVKGKNYRCAIPKLNKEIEPEKCKVIVKPTRVIITLFKACKGNWSDLHYKETRARSHGRNHGLNEEYVRGRDEDMKRTIAKAWTDARSGKTGDSLKVAENLFLDVFVLGVMKYRNLEIGDAFSMFKLLLDKLD